MTTTSRTAQGAADADEARRALERHVTVVEREPWLSLIEERFGIPPAAFDDYWVVRPNNRSLHLVHRDHAPPERPAPDVIGMSFIRTRMRFPKMSTAAAMVFGPQATRNRIALTRPQADAFLSREPFSLLPEQVRCCTGTGYVLGAVDEVILGVGLFRPDDDGGGVVRSMLPKAWTLADEASAFDTDLEP